MIPDKIYCGNNGHGNLSFSSSPFDFASEYIRKGALLEWAKETKEIMSLGGHVSIDDIISKIESL